jgi:hypothetical protein
VDKEAWKYTLTYGYYGQPGTMSEADAVELWEKYPADGPVVELVLDDFGQWKWSGGTWEVSPQMRDKRWMTPFAALDEIAMARSNSR